MFQRRHMEAVANVIMNVTVRGRLSRRQASLLITEFAVLFGESNPNFKPSRFEKACTEED